MASAAERGLSSMRILVVGLGSMGRRRIRNLRALGVADIVGFDPREDRRHGAASDYGIATFETWNAAADSGAIAWVISTPPLSHLAYALQALDRGAHVFTEADLPDPLIRDVIIKRGDTDLVAVPSCTMRHYPGPRKVCELVRGGSIGKPLLFTYQSGQFLPDWHPWEAIQDFYVSHRETGAAREIVPFELVWLTDLFGPVRAVTGLRGNTGVLDADIDDHYALALSFGSAVTGTLLIDVLARPEVRSFRVNGTRGTLEWDQSEGLVRTRDVGSEQWTEYPLDAGTREADYINPEEPYIAELKDFFAAVNGEGTYPFRFEDELALHEVLERAECNVTEFVA